MDSPLRSINNGTVEFSIDDLVRTGTLTQQECEWREHARIPYGDGAALWRLKDDIDLRIEAAMLAGKINPIKREVVEIAAPYVRSDYIPPSRGVDGKVRDSKSDYYGHLKATGHHIVDYEQKPRNKVEGDFNCKKELKEAVQQVLSKQPAKRKKR